MTNNSGKILVTGGAGYIGSHTCLALLDKGFQPVIADNFSTSRRDIPELISKISGKKVETAELDLTDAALVAKLFANHGPFDAIIHFAAFKSVAESVDEPLKYLRNNVCSLMNVLTGMKGGDRIVFSSSCTVYGKPDRLPVTEDAPFGTAFSPYGKSKQICEEILNTVSEKESFKSISLRYFNPIGAHESGLIGEFPVGVPNNLLPYLTASVSGKLETLQVFGDDYPTPDGTCIRDFIHVSDLAEAHVMAVKRLLEKNEAGIETYNVGTGTGYSVLEVIKSFEEVTGQKVPYQVAPRRPGDIDQIWSDTSQAKQGLNWEAKRSLTEMLNSAWKWEQKNK